MRKGWGEKEREKMIKGVAKEEPMQDLIKDRHPK